MLDINLIREHPDKVKENLKRKFREDLIPLVDKTQSLDEQWRELKGENDKARAERNKLSKEINAAKKAGKDAKDLLAKAKKIPEEITKRDEKMGAIYEEIKKNLKTLPNMVDGSVKMGKDDSENEVVRTWGEPKKPDFKLLSNGEIAERLGAADFEQSAVVSGSGFYYLKGDLALLNQALIRFGIEHMVKKGYEYVETPLMLRHAPYEGVVPMEDFQEAIYKIEGEDLHLIATAEHSLMSLYYDQTIPKEQLPIKIVSYSMCFRKEVGSHGLDEKGLFRTHQFNKVEQVVICEPKDSPKMYEEMLKNTEELFQALEIPYQVLDLCTGDLSAVKAKSLDLEAWMPRGETYREVTSLSNCTDYQARGMNIKVINKKGEKHFPHTLNNTVCATSRAMVAILENFQNKDGSVTIPKALRPYMFGKDKIVPRS